MAASKAADAERCKRMGAGVASSILLLGMKLTLLSAAGARAGHAWR